MHGPVRDLKIDTEGHDTVALRGAVRRLAAKRPTVIIESVADGVRSLLRDMDYASEVAAGSSNVVDRHPGG